MKKFLVLLSVLVCITLCGCSQDSDEKILKNFSDKVTNAKSYFFTGQVEMENNETGTVYAVNVSYTKKNKFEVCLQNQ